MKTLHEKKSFVCILAALIMILAVSCKEKPAEKLTGIITFKVGSVLINGKTAAPGEKIEKNDTIVVKKNSALVIQFSTSALITIKPDTTLKIADLMYNDSLKPAIELYQSSGSTFSKIRKGGADYTLRTPTAVAGVRGTSFYVSVKENQASQVKLLHGEVKVELNDKGKAGSATLNNGEMIESSAKGLSAVKSLGKDEQKKLEKMDEIELLPDSRLKETSVGTKPVIMPKDVEKVIMQDDDNGYSIPYLKKRYGSLSRIRTTDGAEYIGSFKQTGDRMEIVSTKGKFILPVSMIKKVSPY